MVFLILEQQENVVFYNMIEEERKNLCRNLFSLRMFIEKKYSQEDDVPLLVQAKVKELIEDDAETQFIPVVIKKIIGSLQKLVLRCFISEEIGLYLTDGVHESNSYFALFHKSGMKNFEILGFIEPNQSTAHEYQIEAIYIKQRRRTCK